MKVLLFGGWGYEGIGGTEGFTRNLATSLDKQDQDVSVLTHKLDDEKDTIRNGIKIFYVPKFPRIKYFPPIYLIRFLFIFIKAVQICHKEKIEIIITREPESLPLLFLRMFGVKVIIRGCTFSKNIGIEVDSHVNNKIIRSVLKSIAGIYGKIIFKLGNLFIESSNQEVNDAKKLTNKRIVHIPYAIDQGVFYPLQHDSPNVEGKEKALVYTGILRPIKKIDLLIKLFDKIRKIQQIKLYLVGPIKEPYSEGHLRALSGFGEDISFFGEKNPAETADILRKSYIFVQTASDFGNSPLEAAACGLPVVALGDFKEDFGIFVKNEEGFIKEVSRLLDDEFEYQKESYKNELYVEKNRTLDMTVTKYISELESL